MSTDQIIAKPSMADHHDHGPAHKVQARLKWFNATKGFGFLVPVDDPCDAFVHITTLQDADIHELGDGAVIDCEIVKGPKGALVTSIDKLIHSGNEPMPVSHRIEEIDSEELIRMDGTVKWYKDDKGFGFIIPADGQKDVFIHQSCLERHGLSTLAPGQHVVMKMREVAKGREVVELSLSE